MQRICCNWLEKMQKTVQQDQPDLEQQNQASRQQAIRFIITQLVTTFVMSAISLSFDFTIAYSSLTGGLIATLANAWFALKVFRLKPTVKPEILLTAFYVGEIYRFIFTGAMFVIAFVLIKPLSVVALLVTYFLIHLTPALVNVFSIKDIQQQQR
jgi:ATP synthase protein I